jgi:hypothetical protein
MKTQIFLLAALLAITSINAAPTYGETCTSNATCYSNTTTSSTALCCATGTATSGAASVTEQICMYESSFSSSGSYTMTAGGSTVTFTCNPTTTTSTSAVFVKMTVVAMIAGFLALLFWEFKFFKIRSDLIFNS